MEISLPGQIANLYTWALGIGAVVALGVLVFGGILYTTSAGNESKITEAKEWVFGALIGLFILFGSYLILNTINPELTKLASITLEKNKPAKSNGTPSQTAGTNATYSPQPSSGNPVPVCRDYSTCRNIYITYCRGEDCSYPSDVLPLSQTVLLSDINIPYVSGKPGVRITENLIEPLRRAGEIAHNRGYTLYITSGYRSLKRQLEIALANWQIVPDFIAYPGGSNHGSGRAVDINLLGGPPIGSSENCRILAEVMYQAGWERYIPEYWHFEYPAGSGNPTRSTSVFSC